ncbi:alpha/beta fold hydrolase [Cupriavidus sp. AU9028]|uniref:alpha/beta fold hydrolase n=1 Tax=Cupriavidus sp. AU9028 TaxID=2871157 RepID=UPI001C96058B|nr:alpha/beta fold hydrolase [Cupriavidus sp. AU9028]MBY4899113.1 alpha/beta fold hydrolase [Cupriavidus sp. AU9028]
MADAAPIDIPSSIRPDTGANAILARLAAATQVRVDTAGRTRIVWRTIGQGSPLVLIHGGHGSWLHWVRNIEALSAAHTVWLPDLPSFGESGDLGVEPHAPDRLDRLVDAVAGSMRRVLGSATDPGLAGFSFGGLVAAHLATAVPGIARIALLGSAGHGSMRRQKLEMMDWRTEDPEQSRAALRHNLAALMLHEEASIDPLALAVHAHSCRTTRFRSKAISRHPLLEPALDRFAGPTLLIWGEHDVTAAPADTARRLVANAPNRDWSIIAGAGHWVQYERAQQINQRLLQWFSPAG